MFVYLHVFFSDVYTWCWIVESITRRKYISPTLEILMIFEYRIFQRQTCVAFWSVGSTMYNTAHPSLKLSIWASQNGPMTTRLNLNIYRQYEV